MSGTTEDLLTAIADGDLFQPDHNTSPYQLLDGKGKDTYTPKV